MSVNEKLFRTIPLEIFLTAILFLAGTTHLPKSIGVLTGLEY
jgi:hypothetical protein